MSGACVPDDTGRALVLSLTRLNRVREIDPLNNTMTVEAGCILQNLQEVAREANRLLPLSLAAEGSCTIGGNLSTNAGGVAVLRYGNARGSCARLKWSPRLARYGTACADCARTTPATTCAFVRWRRRHAGRHHRRRR